MGDEKILCRISWKEISILGGTKMTDVPITIIGGGAVGNAVAYELSKEFGDSVYLLEKNEQLACDNQSARNSGVIHAGIYYPKQKAPNKVEVCVEGNRLLYDFCEQHGVPSKRTGKLVVATDLEEHEYLEGVYKTAVNNGVPGVRWVDRDEAKEMEPNIELFSGIYCPTTGIIAATEYVQKLHKLASEKGVAYALGNEVIGIKPLKDGFEVTTMTNGEEVSFTTSQLVNSAGLYSDLIAKMVNPDSPFEMDPIKGEAAKFYRTKREDIWYNGVSVYQPAFAFNIDGSRRKMSFKEFQSKFLGGEIMKTVSVHLTPTFDYKKGEFVIGDTVTLGPAPVPKVGREDYQHMHGLEYYVENAKPFFPNITVGDLELHQTGVRAKLKEPFFDFVIERDLKHPRLVNLVGIDSPGLTSSLAIAKKVRAMFEGFKG